jgi:hypothetical protein
MFTEDDGTEALYVGGLCSMGYNPDVPDPRLLRTVDGETFQPVPQDEGTFREALLIKGSRSTGSAHSMCTSRGG